MCFLEKVREKFDLHIEINGMVRDFLYTSTYDERSCFILFLIMIQLLMKKDSTIHTISEIRKF